MYLFDAFLIVCIILAVPIGLYHNRQFNKSYNLDKKRRMKK